MLLHLLHGEFTIDREADMRALLMHFEITASLCVLGILSSHYVLLIHKVWSIAVPMEVRLALLPFAPFAHAAFEP